MIPQIIILVLGMLGLGMDIARHGEYMKTKKIDAWASLFTVILTWLLLYWGGFWDPLFN